MVAAWWSSRHQAFSSRAASQAACNTYRLSAYDAAHLELAIREGLPLATLDDDLRRAASAAGVKLVDVA
jgi:predicted nucleic acid-binding protein